jgi:protease-4
MKQFKSANEPFRAKKMSEFFKMFFASLLAMVVAGFIVVGLIVGIIISAASSVKTQKNAKTETASILLIETDKSMHEQGEDNSFASLSDDISHTAGLYDAVRALREAKTDNNIKAVLLKLEGSSNGWATMQQLREALLDFRKSGKKVYAYGEGISQRDYYLATAADAIYLNPVGMLELKGLASQTAFYKGTLEKLNVKPEIFYAGKFKSATEPFRADKMSDENRIQIGEVLHDVWAQMLMAVSSKTGMDTASVQAAAASGGVQFAARAQSTRLIDGAKYWDEVEALLRPLVSVKETEKVPYVSLGEYAGNLSDGVGDGKIAVLFAEGEIVDGSAGDYQIGSTPMVKTIRQIRNDDKIKAVVLRVNSPGGSALASEVILRELQLLKAKKPLIVSMGDVAASGGYYISAAADSIFALPNTITGSIGVFSMMFNIGDALNSKLGVTFDAVKTAPYADFPTSSRQLTPQEMAIMQSSVDTIYHTFKSRVAAGRRMTINQVDSIAQGRVWTGTDALAIGLVDKIGNLNRALQSAAAKANLKDYKVVTYPEPVDQFKSMLKKLRGNPLAAASIRQAMQEELGDDYAHYQQLQWMRRNNGKAQMALPWKIDLR